MEDATLLGFSFDIGLHVKDSGWLYFMENLKYCLQYLPWMQHFLWNISWRSAKCWIQSIAFSCLVWSYCFKKLKIGSSEVDSQNYCYFRFYTLCSSTIQDITTFYRDAWDFLLLVTPSIPKYKAQPPLIQRPRNNYYHLVVWIMLINTMHASNRIRGCESEGFKELII